MRRKDIKPLPPLERLQAMFAYCPLTGRLTWKRVPASFKRAKVGDEVGTATNRHGYRVVGIDRVYFYAHRIIWKLMTGTDPADQIDHIDGDRLNNRWANFRAADNGSNRWNTKLQKNNRSGVKGVCWIGPPHNRWLAYIGAGSGQIKLGRFKRKEDAVAARLMAAEKMHGEFMRVA